MVRGVLFDLDGTLLDSAPDLVGSLNYVRSRLGLEPLPVRDMQTAAAAGAVSLLKAGMPGAADDEFERWRQEFLDHYRRHCFVNSALYEGARKLLSFLESHSMPWGIVTNKPEQLTRPILVAAGLDKTISAVVCGDTTAEMKPHPAPVLLGCEQLNLSPEQVLFVGDDPRDLEAGAAAGVRNCAVMYGYGSANLSAPEHAALMDGAITVESLACLVDWLHQAKAGETG